MGDLTASTSLTVWPHPVTAEGRQTPPVLIDGETTAADLARAHMGGAHRDEVGVVLDGEILPPEDHTLPVPLGTRQVVISVRPGRDIFRSIALIALAVVAPILAPLIFPTLGATALAFATTGIVTVGGLLINALIPIRAPDLGGVENVPLEPVYSPLGRRQPRPAVRAAAAGAGTTPGVPRPRRRRVHGVCQRRAIPGPGFSFRPRQYRHRGSADRNLAALLLRRCHHPDRARHRGDDFPRQCRHDRRGNAGRYRLGDARDRREHRQDRHRYCRRPVCH